MYLKRSITVNWGNLPAEELEYGPVNLFSGGNGSGKTTAADALQTLMTAAHDNLFNYNPGQDETTQRGRGGKQVRTLASYILGCDDGAYARPWDSDGYIAGVFHPTKGETAEAFTAVIGVRAHLDRADFERVVRVNLIGSFTNRTITATGVSLGMERILEVVREFETLPQMPPSADVFVVVFPDTAHEAAGLAVRLRNTGLRADLGTQPHRGVGDQLKYAARKSIPFAVIAGAVELASGQVGMKNLITGEQNQVALADLESAADQFISRKESV